ncbi:4611_t:CDS:1, partial [Ambispora gerdemannii]
MIAHIAGIHMHKSHWQDPEKFIPERFLKGKDAIEKNSFIPFGGGVRLCPGRFVAMAALKVLTVSLFGKYEVELVHPNQPVKTIFKVGNAVKEMKVYLTPKVTS